MRGFNPWLVQLHGEISIPLPLSHIPWGSALVLAPPLCVGHPQASDSHPGKRGQKQRLIGAHLLRLGRDKAVATGVCVKCLQWQRPARSCNRLGCACSGRSPSQCSWRQGLACWKRVCDCGSTPCTPHDNGASFPRQTTLPLGAFPAAGVPHSHPVRLSPHSQEQSSPQIRSPNPML